MTFRDKTVLITGGSNGIGKAIAGRLAQMDANVMIVGRNLDRLHQAVSEYPTLSFVQADLSDPDSYHEIVRSTVARYGGIDVLVNNAGLFRPIAVDDVSDSDLHEIYRVNVFAPALLVREALPFLKRAGGHVINIGSSLGHIARSGQVGYGPSKAALEQLTRNLALELAPHGIYVNCIAPGPTDTGILESSGFSDVMIEQSNADMETMLPLGRRGQPDEIADIVIKICDPATQWLTGQILSVDGGMSIA